jgi:hypothetical protein
LNNTQQETTILKNLHIQPSSLHPSSTTLHTHPSSPSTWSHPPPSFLKLIFYGASKGNPGPSSYVGTFRNNQGQILIIDANFIGIERNNYEKIQDLEAGLNISIRECFHMIIIEGEYQLIIQMLHKLQHGIPLRNLTTNWRLSTTLECIHSILLLIEVTIPSHVKHSNNKLDDHLYNE